tara:strand:- start:327 stop:569 length:243 start_codon:yes stop_codon:yes gene_type:complete
VAVPHATLSLLGGGALDLDLKLNLWRVYGKEIYLYNKFFGDRVRVRLRHSVNRLFRAAFGLSCGAFEIIVSKEEFFDPGY